MNRYSIVFSDEALDDLASCIEWGCETWGEEATWRWYAKMQDSINKVLGISPLGSPIAPDNDEYEVEVRQMVIERYRVLYNVRDEIVTILYVRGPYTGSRK